MDAHRLRSKLANLMHLNADITLQEKLLAEAETKRAHWEGASDEAMETLRALFAELADVLPQKKISFTNNNNIEGLRSQLSSAQRKVRDAIYDISSSLDELTPVPNGHMPAQSIHVVFISSTFEDLRKERAEVQRAS